MNDPGYRHAHADTHIPRHILAPPMYVGSSKDTGSLSLPSLSDLTIEWDGRSCPKSAKGCAYVSCDPNLALCRV